MVTPPSIERGILVFSIWFLLGFLGLGFILEGFARDSIAISLLGTGLIMIAFVAHIIVNAIFHQGFTAGETALGISSFGLLALTFILAWLFGNLSAANYLSGLSLFALLAVGFITYLATRYGLRGAFSRFHIQSPTEKGARR